MPSGSQNTAPNPDPGRASAGLFELGRRAYHHDKINFLLHLLGIGIGILAVAIEIAAPALHEMRAVALIPSVGVPAPPHFQMAGLDFILKICALMFIQWAIARVHLFIQTALSNREGAFWIIVGIVVCLFVAWVSIINIGWLTIPPGATLGPRITGTHVMVGLGIAISWIVHASVFGPGMEKLDGDLGRAVIWLGTYVVIFVVLGVVITNS